eukprot:807064-Prorocentrum_minimum.AAC.4
MDTSRVPDPARYSARSLSLLGLLNIAVDGNRRFFAESRTPFTRYPTTVQLITQPVVVLKALFGVFVLPYFVLPYYPPPVPLSRRRTYLLTPERHGAAAGGQRRVPGVPCRPGGVRRPGPGRKRVPHRLAAHRAGRAHRADPPGPGHQRAHGRAAHRAGAPHRAQEAAAQRELSRRPPAHAAGDDGRAGGGARAVERAPGAAAHRARAAHTTAEKPGGASSSPVVKGLIKCAQELKLEDNLLTSIIPLELAGAVALTRLELTNNLVMCGVFNSAGTSSVDDSVVVTTSGTGLGQVTAGSRLI